MFLEALFFIFSGNTTTLTWANTTTQGTLLYDRERTDREFIVIEGEMQSTIRGHKDNGHAGGTFSRYNVIKVR